MDTIDKWLKSLRLHKYTHLFKSLTYDEMLNLEEKYLVEREVTKGARNKMLISVKKLNLRQERLSNMMDDLEQQNISMKEALTVLKDMLITPIPRPSENRNNRRQLLSNIQNSINNNKNTNQITKTTAIGSANNNKEDNPKHLNQSQNQTNNACNRFMYSTNGNQDNNRNINNYHNNNTTNNYLDPYDLTYLFIETLEKVAQRLIESIGVEDNACHGIMASIVDECLKHNSFTNEQKAKVASYKKHLTKEQTAKTASFKHQQHNNITNSRQQPQTHNYNFIHHNNLHHHQHSHHHHNNSNNNNNNNNNSNSNGNNNNSIGSIGKRQKHHYHFNNINSIHHYNHSISSSDYHWNHHHGHGPIQSSLSSTGSSSHSSTSSASSTCSSSTAQLSSIGSDIVYHYQPLYSLFKPGITFELPCLRALTEQNRHSLLC